jgi:hypothetical protein
MQSQVWLISICFFTNTPVIACASLIRVPLPRLAWINVGVKQRLPRLLDFECYEEVCTNLDPSSG